VQQIERDGSQHCQTYVHIHMTLKFLTLQGAPYIYDISRLRVNEQGKNICFIYFLPFYVTLSVQTVFWVVTLKNSVCRR
jgi:hypothetical protein